MIRPPSRRSGISNTSCAASAANVNQIAHNANREMNATIEDEASASYAVRQCRELIDHLDAVIGQSGGVPDDANRSEEGQALRTVRL